MEELTNEELSIKIQEIKESLIAIMKLVTKGSDGLCELTEIVHEMLKEK